MLGAVVSRSTRWHGFYSRWKKLLAKEGIPFSHIVAMETGKRPFDGWDGARARAFVRQSIPIMGRYCDFGVTVATNLDEYQAEYREKMVPKTSPDSAYGVCSRQIIRGVVDESRFRFGDSVRLNFIFEKSHMFGGAFLAFNETKNYSDIGKFLGTIKAGEKIDFAGLQCADLVASLGRRSEPSVKFNTPTQPRSYAERSEPFPLYHYDLDLRALATMRMQIEQIALERRGRRRARGFLKRNA